MILPYLKGDILDLGCGYEGLVKYLSPGQHYTGVDVNPSIVSRLRTLYPQYQFEECDLDHQDLSLPKTYDTIVMLAVLEHLAHPDRLMKSLSHHLNPGGNIVLTTPTPFGNFLHYIGSRLGLFYLEASLDHKIIYDRPKLVKLLKNAMLRLENYQLFLAGGNQMCVASRMLLE